MAEYIDREAIRYEQEMRYTATYDLTELPVAYSGVPVAIVRKSVIDAMPAADVAPVVHGYFVHDGPRFAGGVDWWHCSNCGRLTAGVETRFAYCPNCGARMDGDSDATD